MRKKYLTKATKEPRIYFGSWFKSSPWWESQQQELERTGHTTIRKGIATNTRAPLSLSVLLRTGPNPGDYNIHIHSRSLLQFKSFWKRSLRPVRRCVSIVILNPGKLTVTVKCHSDEHVFCERCGDGSHPVRVRLKEVGCPCSWLVPLSRQNPSTKTAQRVFSRLALGRLGSPDCFWMASCKNLVSGTVSFQAVTGDITQTGHSSWCSFGTTVVLTCCVAHGGWSCPHGVIGWGGQLL